ncbi:hypothetical protein G5I_10294 [Acromyrmex echinatior]|uniref:Uncharacterized protein n=1 Tax=Acromyrmex echinatior TaxID=103372 RepID=F4WWH7_ACREC|nr:hypothetical protein G5I_10294 [Acromyrmex echinatior]
MPSWFSCRLVSFRFIPFRFVDRLVEALEEPPSRASITADSQLEEDGSGDGRNKKVENLESQSLRFFSAAQTPARILVRKNGEKMRKKETKLNTKQNHSFHEDENKVKDKNEDRSEDEEEERTEIL